MGSCSSVEKTKRAASPHKKKPLNGESTVKVVGSSFNLKKTSELGSKEEMFFDSQAWLDSDCDDDFFSVNGDFTPSRGSTPNNQTSFFSRAKSDKTFAFDKSPDTKSETSPTGRKKLSDLFQETPELNAANEKPESNGEHDSSQQTNSDLHLDRANAASSSEVAQSGDLMNRKNEERRRSVACQAWARASTSARGGRR